MELRDFIEAYIQKSAEQPGSLQDYMHNFTNFLAKAVSAGNLSDYKQKQWFVYGLLTNYCRHAMAKTGTVADKPDIFNFDKLRKAVELYIMAAEDAKHMAIFLGGNTQNVQIE